MIPLHVDASEAARLARVFGSLPKEIRHRIAARAMRRVVAMGDTAITRDVRDLVQINYGAVRRRVSSAVAAGGLSFETRVRSGFIPLIELPDRMKEVGVGLSRRGMERRLKRHGQTLKGSYRAAFEASVHAGPTVFRREGASRGPLDEQFGPNPAHAVLNAPGRYERLLTDVVRLHLLNRVLHEMSEALPK